MLRSVLVPTDFTEEGVLITEYAEGLPALGVRRVVLTNVVEASGMEGPVIAAAVDRVRGSLLKRAERLKECCGLQVEVRVPTGDPAEELLALASEVDCDGVVVGTHGKALVERLVTGSVSGTILHDAPCPIMFARFSLLAVHSDPAALARAWGSALLLPTDFSASATRALMAVLELPSGTVRTLYLLHVLDPSLDGEKLRRAETGAEFELGDLAEMARREGIAATTAIRRGEPDREVLAEAERRRVTGVATGRRGRGALTEAVLGSVSATLMRQASCPVLVVP
ncbi:MAG: universal stress protein [Coriobacteriia bacterium]|nr:universal stress protein [Coriobacteriia bacterium]